MFISIGSAVESTAMASAGQVTEISARELAALMTASQDLVIIDVDTPGQYKEGHIKGSLFGDGRLLRTQPEEYLDSLGVDKSKKIILVCETGHKSRRIAETLLKTNYHNVYNLEGGKLGWARSGFNLISGGK
jgi:rhodanese-related sulfurtransferase